MGAPLGRTVGPARGRSPHGSTAIVVTGGDPPHPTVRDRLPTGATVIAADSGLDHAIALGLRVDRVVGDLDSVSPEALAAAARAGRPRGAPRAPPAAGGGPDPRGAAPRRRGAGGGGGGGGWGVGAAVGF